MNRTHTPPLLLDVGGTFIKCRDGRQIPIRSDGTRDEIVAALREAVGQAPAAGVGIAIPGPFDYKDGIFLMKHKFASVYGLSFRELAGIPEEIPLRFLHDANAPLAGAIVLSGCTGNSALITLGTGLGFAYALNGVPQCGPDGSPARSLYDLPYRDGILEDILSARGLRKAYRDKSGKDLASAFLIAQMAYTGDEPALEVFSDFGTVLGSRLAPVLREEGIDTLWFGGQVSKSFSLFERPLRSALEDAPALRHIGPLPEGAVFAGLKTLFE